MENEKISIIMPVYNGVEHLNECIQSILAQTYTNFELLVLDDGSTDNSARIAQNIDDPRVRVIMCEHDFTTTLNIGITSSKGEFIARMDCDDIMFPNRLQMQIDILKANNNIAVCSTYAQTFGLVEKVIGQGSGNIDNALSNFLRGNYIIHPSVMLRSSFVREHQIAYKNHPYAEDYRMWVDICAAGGEFYVIPVPLIYYRISENQISIQHRTKQDETATLIRQEILEMLLETNTIETNLLKSLYEIMVETNHHNLIDSDDIFTTFSNIFYNLHHQKLFIP